MPVYDRSETRPLAGNSEYMRFAKLPLKPAPHLPPESRIPIPGPKRQNVADGIVYRLKRSFCDSEEYAVLSIETALH